MPKVLLKSGLNVHYLRVGDGPDLVMIHGLIGNLAVWHLRMVGLLRDHFRVLTYDLRGHGYTDLTPAGYSTGEMANDLRELLDSLEIERPFLLGHSYGADIALYLALTNPERVQRIVAIEAGLPALIGLRKREDWEGWTYWVEILRGFGIEIPPERRCDLDYMLRASLDVPKVYGPAIGRPRNREWILRLLDETSIVSDYEVVGELTLQSIPRIQTPVLLIYGVGSAFLGTYEYLRQHLANVESVVLPSSTWGHFGPLEQPDLVIQHTLAALEPGTPADAGPAAGRQ